MISFSVILIMTTEWVGIIYLIYENHLMRPINVFMVIHRFRPLIGGAEVYAENLGKRLVERGHNVNVLTLGVKSAPRKEDIDGMKIHRLSAPDKPGLRFFIFFLKVFIELFKNRSKIDVIHAYQIYTGGIVLVLFGKILRKPVIIREGSHTLYYFMTLEGFLKGRMMSWAMRNAKEVYCITPKFVRSMKMAGARPDVLWSPVDADLFSPVKNKNLQKRNAGLNGRFVVLFVGRLVSFKNVSCLIEAVPKLSNDIKGLSVVIVGDGPERKHLEDQAKSLGVSEKVRFVGHLPLIKTADYYRIADVFVHPAVSNMKYEKDLSFPSNTIYQAMASGIPSVSTVEHQLSESRLPVVKETLVMESGMAMKPNSPGHLAEAVLKIYRNESLRKRLGANARKTALKKLDWDLHVNKMVEKYGKMISHMA